MKRPSNIDYHFITLKTKIELRFGSRLYWKRGLELSVDDPFEGRVDRTVSIEEDAKKGFNRKTQKVYPGAVVAFKESWELTEPLEAKSGKIVESTYTCKLPFSSFKDPKNEMLSSESVDWARVSFEISCGKCGEKATYSSQTNLGTPREIKCSCGETLGLEHEQQPLILAVD